MIYTPSEYAKEFTFGGKHVSSMTIKRRCAAGQLPRYHKAYKKTGGWIIEVPDFPENLRNNYTVNLTLKKEAILT
jgi:hypothetical protein